MATAQRKMCAVCGRRANRGCPALAGSICPACCGSRRGTKIDCPPECTHFPFGTVAYDLWLKVDDSWQPKALVYVAGRVGKDEFMQTAKDFAPSWAEGESALVDGGAAALMYHLVIGDDDNTPPLGEVWKREGWPGLNNDERYLAEFRCRSMPAILEVQKILDGTAMECVDLLDPERGRFIVFDRNTASTVARFTRMVVWITHYPHFSRLTGNGVILPSEFVDPFLWEIRERTEEAFQSKSDEYVKRYLAEFFGEAYALVDILGDEMREQFTASLDADRCAVFYELLVPREEIESILEEKPDIRIEEDWELGPDEPTDATYYAWLRRGEAKAIEKESPRRFQNGESEEDAVETLGTIRLSSGELKVETTGRKRFKFAKKLVGRYFQKKLKRAREEITPIAQLLEEADRSKGALTEPSEEIPPEIEEQLMQEFYTKHYKQLLDEPIPMIDNLTPRKAALVPSVRPKLIELVKLHLNRMDNMRREKGYDINIDWIVDELGLDELR